MTPAHAECFEMDDPAELPEGVAELLDQTLGPDGAPGILADWLDDHSSYWDGFAAALRQSELAGPHVIAQPGFRYQIVCRGVMFWACEGELWAKKKQPRQEVVVFGVYRVAPFAPAMWRRVVHPNKLPKAVRRRLWEAFGISRWADND